MCVFSCVMQALFSMNGFLLVPVLYLTVVSDYTLFHSHHVLTLTSPVKKPFVLLTILTYWLPPPMNVKKYIPNLSVLAWQNKQVFVLLRFTLPLCPLYPCRIGDLSGVTSIPTVFPTHLGQDLSWSIWTAITKYFVKCFFSI